MEQRKNEAYVTWGLIGINVVYFLYLDWVGSPEDPVFMLEHGAMFVPYVLAGEYFRLLLSIFMHFGISHLVNNMLVLFVLGNYLERAMGRVKYLLFYLACGIGANLVSVAYDLCLTSMGRMPDAAVSAGASGAIFGVSGGLLYVVMANRGRLEDLQVKQVGLMIILSLYLGFRSVETDNLAHVAGAVIGFILAALLYRRPQKKQ